MTNDAIVGTGHIDRKKGATLNLSSIDPAKRKKKLKMDKKKSKKRKRHSSDESDRMPGRAMPPSAAMRGERGSARLKGPGDLPEKALEIN